MTSLPKFPARHTAALALALAVFIAPSLRAEVQPAAPVNSVKLLTIGNSFADNSTSYLPGMAKASGKELVLAKANLGGHSMQQHVNYLQAYEADPTNPKASPYVVKFNKETGEKEKASLRQILEREPWDYVTIQQVSYLSYKMESFEPYAGTLISYIQKHAPTAKILIHQTWEYRSDAPLYTKEKLSPEQMFEGLKLAYSKIAKDYSLGIIPVGEAFHTAIAMPRWNSISTDPDYDFDNPAEGVLPMQSPSLYRGWVWETLKSGKKRFVLDTKHASPTGRYLGAAVFYNMLFREQPNETFCPDGVDPIDTPVLRQIASEVVKAHSPTATAVQLTAGK